MRHFFYLLLAILSPLAGISQTSYDLKSMPPLDPAVRTGVLPNGMHYYIRVNKLPEKRGEFYIAHNVGAIQEEDDQNGLAHFTEHMAFNGTTNYPKKSLLNYLASIGVKFGTNVNAGTGVEQTVYNLSNVPLTREGIIDSALLILHDWSGSISFVPEEVDLERGVIREEWRMYGSAGERMNNQLLPVVYKGSKYATRNIIGDTAVINHFKHQTIKDFYKKWYRTNLQAIVVVGDFDLTAMEAKIIKLFSSIPKVDNPTPKEIYPVPDNNEPLIGTATDKEATGTMVRVSYKHDAIPEHEKNLGYMRIQLERSLINAMFGQRMQEIARTENPPFLMAYTYYGGFTRSKDAFTGMAQAANNQAPRALTSLLTEMERMKLHGFTVGEFDRAKANLMRQYESRYMDRDKRKNRELVYPNVSNFLSNTPNPGIEFEYAFAQNELPGITLAELNAMARGFVRDNNMIVTITGPAKEGITIPSEAEISAILKSYRSAQIGPYVDAMAGKKLMEKEPIPGKVTQTNTNTALGTIEWTLSNGMRVVFKPTDIREDELIVSGYSAGGLSLIPTSEVRAAALLGDAVSQMGIGTLSRTDLNKLMAGKRVQLYLSLTDNQEQVNVRTSPKDLEMALQMINLTFTHPRWSQTDYTTWLEKLKAYYINASVDPRTAFSDSIVTMMSNHNPRSIPMNYKNLEEVTYEKLQSVYRSRFADPGNFTFQFTGKVDPEKVKPLIEKYLASLPGHSRKEAAKDDGVRPPKGRATNDFKRENKTPRTSVFINYNGTCGYTADDRLFGAALRHVLELRYIQAIREDEGGTYSVRVSYAVNSYPQPGFMMTITFDTDPLKADKLVSIVHKEIKNILDLGPTETDLQKAKEYFLKQRPEDMKENTWWNNTLSEYYFNNLDYLTGFEEKVKALSVSSVHNYAKKVFNQGNIVEVIMRP